MWTLWDDLKAFFQEHRRCGELESGVEDRRVWMTCDCGAVLTRLLPSRGLPGTVDPPRFGF